MGKQIFAQLNSLVFSYNTGYCDTADEWKQWGPSFGVSYNFSHDREGLDLPPTAESSPPTKNVNSLWGFSFFRSPQKGSLASMIKIKKAIEMSPWNQVWFNSAEGLFTQFLLTISLFLKPVFEFLFFFIYLFGLDLSLSLSS